MPNFLPDINNPEKRSPARVLTGPRIRSQKQAREWEPPQPAQGRTPTLSKDDIALAQFHNSVVTSRGPHYPTYETLLDCMFQNCVKQNTCVEMLRGGFHRSFRELFLLLQRWREMRQAAGPGSAVWQQTPLEEQPSKLHTLQLYLTQAEAAQRTGAWAQMYDSQVSLAQVFDAPEDRWLSRHFYQASLAAARRLIMDGGRKEAEASANMGQVYMEQGQLDSARGQLELFYQLTLGRAWRSEEGGREWGREGGREGGRSLHHQACEALWRVYTLLAERPLQAGDYRPAIQTLTKAFDMAREAGDRKIEGEAAYSVGMAYQWVGDQQTAKKFLNMYMEISTALGDAEGLGKAYKAIAKSLESEGKLGESVQYLEKFAEVSQSNNQQHNLAEACMCLGLMYTSRGQYERGVEYFQQGYDITRDLGEAQLLQRAQVSLGGARAHAMMRSYSRQVEPASRPALLGLSLWKDRREDAVSQAPQEKR